MAVLWTLANIVIDFVDLHKPSPSVASVSTSYLILVSHLIVILRSFPFDLFFLLFSLLFHFFLLDFRPLVVLPVISCFPKISSSLFLSHSALFLLISLNSPFLF